MGNKDMQAEATTYLLNQKLEQLRREWKDETKDKETLKVQAMIIKMGLNKTRKNV